ncbi:MAG: bifunctional riboflavin kinase/FAD synthetase [Peptoniphilus sp.]|nr:bifunctional riboflavin kinase/FAD synthetase [Peptoniphilus sp.]MDY3119316.1 bifunctional riboflavin kinase/FAD synthetase [Peptoniphilus sp.]
MEVIQVDLESEISREATIALGNFDGIHRGHQTLIKEVVEMAEKMHCPSSVLMFKTHTKDTTDGIAQELLTSRSQKHDILRDLGIDIVYEIDFTEAIMHLSPESFFSDFLVDHLKAKGIVVGYDYRFGYKASGNVSTLERLCAFHHLPLSVKEAVSYNGEVVSSTRIRTAVKEGNVTLANTLLTRPFTIRGTVVPGKQLGRTIGIPTANILYDVHYIVPKFGVYFSGVTVDSAFYYGATNIGTNPTFSEQEIKVETYLYDYEGDDLYGKTMDVALFDFIRPEEVFKNVGELKLRMDEDLEHIRKKIREEEFTK